MDTERQDAHAVGSARLSGRGSDAPFLRVAAGGQSRTAPCSTAPRSLGDIGLADLLDARDYVVLLVDRHGEAYLPLFVRLDEELATRHARDAIVQLARRLAREKADRSCAA